MAKNNFSNDLTISREQLVQLLNQDLAREYQAIIAYTVYSQVIKGAKYMDISRELAKHAVEELDHALKIAKQIDYLGGMPVVAPEPVFQSTDPVALLRADLENERRTVANYRCRIRQAENLGEFALSEILRQIIAQEQDHEIDLCDALGIDVPSLPDPDRQIKTGNGRASSDHSRYSLKPAAKTKSSRQSALGRS